ncbi:ribosome biogenesis regulatory protein homolog [Diachasma alloeum]|uniref:ribosome biogenesis regulatory protein homolog n=1 Tax=Diachasma alloeum TaxID=454923 RepID=UPI000738376F|nr:ribosome biogenesis regulatory protein homolog [Diachasma alloeum]
MDVVNAILQEDNEDKSRSTKVDKLIDLDIDEGTLLASDYNAFDNEQLRSNKEEFLKALTRDNAQLLLNKIWALPTERVDEVIIAKLPKPTYIVPRARVVPKPKALTKWQQFAKEKGIRSKKKGNSKLKWDEELNKWIPTFGYKRAAAQEQKDWLVEVGPDNTPKADPRETASNAKQERMAKNELQRLRNLAKAKNVKIPRVGLPTNEQFASAKQLATATTVARVSTASVGKFQNKLPKEKDSRDQVAKEVPGMKKKRKAPPLNIAEEKRRNTDLVSEIVNRKNSKGLLRVDIPSVPAAISRAERKSKKGSKKSVGSKKPKGGKGKRDPHTKVGGRKRRG